MVSPIPMMIHGSYSNKANKVWTNAVTSDSRLALSSRFEFDFYWTRNWSGMGGTRIGIGPEWPANGSGLGADSNFQLSPRKWNLHEADLWKLLKTCGHIVHLLLKELAWNVNYNSNKLDGFVSGPDLSHYQIQAQFWYLLPWPGLRPT